MGEREKLTNLVSKSNKRPSLGRVFLKRSSQATGHQQRKPSVSDLLTSQIITSQQVGLAGPPSPAPQSSQCGGDWLQTIVLPEGPMGNGGSSCPGARSRDWPGVHRPFKSPGKHSVETAKQDWLRHLWSPVQNGNVAPVQKLLRFQMAIQEHEAQLGISGALAPPQRPPQNRALDWTHFSQLRPCDNMTMNCGL